MKEQTHSEPSASNPYLLPLSIILASLIVSGSVLFAVSKFDSTVGLVVAGAKNQQQLAPSNAPSGQLNQPPSQPSQPQAAALTAADLKSIPDTRWEGPANAKVTIVEFSDFQCPFCERFYTDSYKQIKAQYIDTGKARFAFAHFPLSFHPNARPAANAAACAEEQGRFFEFHNKLFENQQSLSDSFYKQTAKDLGLDAGKFNQCYDSKKYDNVISAELQLGQKVGVSGTPTTYVNGKQIVGAQPFETFKTAIDAALAG